MNSVPSASPLTGMLTALDSAAEEKLPVGGIWFSKCPCPGSPQPLPLPFPPAASSTADP